MKNCHYCGTSGIETRAGCCFDCATKGEERAAKRTVMQHSAKGVLNAARGFWTEARFEFQWAWERATRTGDYAPDGYFDHHVPDWRLP